MAPEKNKKKKDPKQKEADKNKTQQDVKGAYNEAQKDIEHDADLSVHSPNDDLDEEEAARSGDDKTDLV
jgi:hypothetical protein